MEDSCKGGLDSPCENGFEGPLCAVCSSGYYKQLQNCKQCPSKKWILGQLLIIAGVLLITVVFLVCKTKQKVKTDQCHHLIDMIFSRLKIVIGFYQVTHGLLEVFSYIKWPGSLEVIAKYSGILQMNLLQISPVHCLFPRIHVDAFGNLCIVMTMNIIIITTSAFIYYVHKAIILRNGRLQDEEKSEKISRTKELVYRNVFFFLYVTYLSTFSKIISVLPFACRKLCRDDKEEFCSEYLKVDYSIQCQGPKYNHLLIVAFISTAYIIALPVASFMVLWRLRRVIITTKDDDTEACKETITGLRFLFENYKPSSWYWELVETSRKVILTCGIILVGQESRSYIGLALVSAGMYGVLFSWTKPIQDTFENRLMSMSLAVTVVNLGIGAVSRIPAENVRHSTDQHTESVALKTFIFGANTLIICLLLGEILMLSIKSI